MNEKYPGLESIGGGETNDDFVETSIADLENNPKFLKSEPMVLNPPKGHQFLTDSAKQLAIAAELSDQDYGIWERREASWVRNSSEDERLRMAAKIQLVRAARRGAIDLSDAVHASVNKYGAVRLRLRDGSLFDTGKNFIDWGITLRPDQGYPSPELGRMNEMRDEIENRRAEHSEAEGEEPFSEPGPEVEQILRPSEAFDG